MPAAQEYGLAKTRAEQLGSQPTELGLWMENPNAGIQGSNCARATGHLETSGI